MPAHSRALSMGFIAGMVGTIALVDYVTDVHISLGLFYLIPIAAVWRGWAGAQAV